VAKCSATKRDGSPCTLPATYADGKCWAHSDATAENRRKGRSRGGRNRTGSGELVEVKREIRAVITDVLERNVERASGAVALQGYNILIRALEAERRVREELIEERLDELEERLEQAKREEGLHGGGYYG
jgi:hypothetical protein